VKKVLIITYYWPPAGGPGVQRVLKFVKYLPQFGWTPLVLTVASGEYPALDLTLEKEIPKICQEFRINAFEPGRLYKRFIGLKDSEKIPVAVLTEKDLNWKKRVANWLRLNFFLPDAKIMWKYPAVKEGKRIISEESPDIIFSSSPPPTVHLIARELATSSGLNWVADFRDPWTNIYHYSELKKKWWAKKIDNHLEYSVLTNASKITVVNQGFFNQENQSESVVLPNGFDSEDYKNYSDHNPNDKFTIRYIGSLKPRQYVDSFFNMLKNLSQEKKYAESIRLELIGHIYPEVRKEIMEKNIALELNLSGYLDHENAVKRILTADLLLLVIGSSSIADKVFSGKIFEYIMARKPILAYGPIDGAASALLTKTRCGRMFDFNDLKGAYGYLLEYYQRWQKRDSYADFNLSEIAQYERKNLTQKLVKIFEELI
jgi:hypothetical protein